MCSRRRPWARIWRTSARASSPPWRRTRATAYKQMLVASGAEDIVYTSLFSGVARQLPARQRGEDRHGSGQSAAGRQEQDEFRRAAAAPALKAWKDIWSAGQSVGGIHDGHAGGRRWWSAWRASTKRRGRASVETRAPAQLDQCRSRRGLRRLLPGFRRRAAAGRARPPTPSGRRRARPDMPTARCSSSTAVSTGTNFARPRSRCRCSPSAACSNCACRAASPTRARRR